jgi:hypothetical protein
MFFNVGSLRQIGDMQEFLRTDGLDQSLIPPCLIQAQMHVKENKSSILTFFTLISGRYMCFPVVPRMEALPHHLSSTIRRVRSLFHLPALRHGE